MKQFKRIDNADWSSLPSEIAGDIRRYLRGILNSKDDNETTLYIESLCSVIGRENDINSTTHVTVKILMDVLIDEPEADTLRILKALSCISFNRPYESDQHMQVYNEFHRRLSHFLRYLKSEDLGTCLTTGAILSRYVLHFNEVIWELVNRIEGESRYEVKIALTSNIRWLLANMRYIEAETDSETLIELRDRLEGWLKSDNFSAKCATLTVYILLSYGEMNQATIQVFDQCMEHLDSLSGVSRAVTSELNLTLSQLPEPKRMDLLLRSFSKSSGENKLHFARTLISLYLLHDTEPLTDKRKQIVRTIADDIQFWEYENSSDHPTHLSPYRTIRGLKSAIE